MLFGPLGIFFGLSALSGHWKELPQSHFDSLLSVYQHQPSLVAVVCDDSRHY